MCDGGSNRRQTQRSYVALNCGGSKTTDPGCEPERICPWPDGAGPGLHFRMVPGVWGSDVSKGVSLEAERPVKRVMRWSR